MHELDLAGEETEAVGQKRPHQQQLATNEALVVIGDVGVVQIDVAIALAVADGETGDRVWSRRYVGIRRQTAEADSKTAWREVMDTALARTMRDVATDADLALSLARTPR